MLSLNTLAAKNYLVFAYSLTTLIVFIFFSWLLYNNKQLTKTLEQMKKNWR
jgi:hypothetical protein